MKGSAKETTINKPSQSHNSLIMEPAKEDSCEDVNAFGVTNPFAIAARNQEQARKRLKTTEYGPWGTPMSSKPKPYLAITEDGFGIRQDGTLVHYNPTMEIVSPRFKQLYKYHRSQPFWTGTPVTEAYLEGKYGQFILNLETPRRKALLEWDKDIRQGFSQRFSLAEMEKRDGENVKKTPETSSYRYRQLLLFYSLQPTQVDMPVTQEWLESHLGAMIPKDYFMVTDRYAQLLDKQKDVRLFEEWLERVYGILVPRSLKRRRLHSLVECFFNQPTLVLTDTALERTYGPLVTQLPRRKRNQNKA